MTHTLKLRERTWPASWQLWHFNDFISVTPSFILKLPSCCRHYWLLFNKPVFLWISLQVRLGSLYVFRRRTLPLGIANLMFKISLQVGFLSSHPTNCVVKALKESSALLQLCKFHRWCATC